MGALTINVGREQRRSDWLRVPLRRVVSALVAFAFALLWLSSTAHAAGLLSWAAPKAIDPQPSQPYGSFVAVSCPSAQFCAAVGTGDVATSNDPAAGAWTWTFARVDGSNTLSAVACPTTTLCVAVDSAGNVLTSTDPAAGAGAWQIAAVSTAPLSTVSCPSTSLCVAGGNGVVMNTTNPAGGGSTWTSSSLPSGEQILSLSCPSSSLCAGVGNSGAVLTTTNPVGGGSAWSTTELGIPGGLRSISCPATSLCVAAGAGGYVASSTNPSGRPGSWGDAQLAQPTCAKYGCSPGFFNAVSCPSASRCLVFDQYDGTVWTSSNPTGGAAAWGKGYTSVSPALNGTSCPSVSFCAAVSGRTVFSSTDPTNTTQDTWSAAADETTPGFTAISCPSASVCFAVDGEGNVVSSADPNGQFSSWSVAHVDVPFGALEGISCPTVSFCVAVDSQGDILNSTDPSGGSSAWQLAHIENPTGPGPALHAVSCPSVSLCIAADNQGNFLTSTDPSGGASAWQLMRVPGRNTFSSISCPTDKFCAAADLSGDVFTSTDPAGGPGAWHWTHISDAFPGGFDSLSCPVSTFCAVLSPEGTVFTSLDPTGGLSAWRNADVAFGGDSIACSSVTLCLLTDGGPGVFASEHPVGAANAWAGQAVEPCTSAGPAGCFEVGVRAVGCPAPTTCIALDDLGNAMIGHLAPPPTAAQVRTALQNQISQIAKRARIRPQRLWPSNHLGLVSRIALHHRAVTVMSYNVFPGSTLRHWLAARTVAQLGSAAAADYEQAVGSEIRARAKKLAAEIQRNHPVAVGLQGAVLWHTAPSRPPPYPGAPLFGPGAAGHVSYDFVKLLLGALAARRAQYRAAAVTDDLELQATGYFPNEQKMDVRYTDRVAILVRRGVSVSNVREHNYYYPPHDSVDLPGSVPGTQQVQDGWAAVDLNAGSGRFRFITTELDPLNHSRSGSIRAAEAKWIGNGWPVKAKLPVIFTCGCYSTPASQTHRELASAGLRDTWSQLHPRLGGATCCHSNIADPNWRQGVTKRSDYIWSRPPFTPLAVNLVGTDPADRALSRPRGFSSNFTAPGAGVFNESWYRAQGNRKPMLIAAGTATFASGETGTVAVKLTTAGRRLLRVVRPPVRIDVVASFARFIGPAMTIRKRITLRR